MSQRTFLRWWTHLPHLPNLNLGEGGTMDPIAQPADIEDVAGNPIEELFASAPPEILALIEHFTLELLKLLHKAAK